MKPIKVYFTDKRKDCALKCLVVKQENGFLTLESILNDCKDYSQSYSVSLDCILSIETINHNDYEREFEQTYFIKMKGNNVLSWLT